MKNSERISAEENILVDEKIDRYLQVKQLRAMIESTLVWSLDKNSDFISKGVVRHLTSMYEDNLKAGDSGEESYNLELAALIEEFGSVQKVE